MTADPDALKAVQTFYKVVTSHHSFPTGKPNMPAASQALQQTSCSPTATFFMLADQQACKLHHCSLTESPDWCIRQPQTQKLRLQAARVMLLTTSAAPLHASVEGIGPQAK